MLQYYPLPRTTSTPTPTSQTHMGIAAVELLAAPSPYTGSLGGSSFTLHLLTSPPRVDRCDPPKLVDGNNSHGSSPSIRRNMGRTTPVCTGPAHASRGPRPTRQPLPRFLGASCGPGVGTWAFSPSRHFECVVVMSFFVTDSLSSSASCQLRIQITNAASTSHIQQRPTVQRTHGADNAHAPHNRIPVPVTRRIHLF